MYFVSSSLYSICAPWGVDLISVSLKSGRYHPVVMEVPDLDVPVFDGVIKFEWTSPHGVRFLVPRALLYLPSEQATIRQPRKTW